MIFTIVASSWDMFGRRHDFVPDMPRHLPFASHIVLLPLSNSAAILACQFVRMNKAHHTVIQLYRTGRFHSTSNPSIKQIGYIPVNGW